MEELHYWANFILEHWYIFGPLALFVVIRYNHTTDEEPTILREDEKEPRARSWLFEFIRTSEDQEEITSHGKTDEGYSVTTRNKYREDTDYIIYEDNNE